MEITREKGSRILCQFVGGVATKTMRDVRQELLLMRIQFESSRSAFTESEGIRALMI